MNTNMDYDSIAKAGSMLGSGAVIIMNEDRCMVESLLRLSYFIMKNLVVNALHVEREPVGFTE